MNTFLENIFLVAGSGRNVGKTTFCCRLIERFSAENRIIAVKITDHFHNLEGQNVNILHHSAGFVIVEQVERDSDKDTSRFLLAGADNSFLIMSDNEHLKEALEKLDLLINIEKNPMIIESGFLLEIIKPAIAGFITDNNEITLNQGFDFVAHHDGNGGFDISIKEFSIYGNKWRFH